MGITIAIVASIIAATAAVASGTVAAVEADRAGRRSKRAGRRQAETATRAASEQAELLRRRAGRAAGAIRARAGAAGAATLQGSPLLVLQESLIESFDEIRRIQQGGASQAAAFNKQGRNRAAAASAARAGAVLQTVQGVASTGLTAGLAIAQFNATTALPTAP